MTTEVVFDDSEAPRGQAADREPTALGRFVEELRRLRSDMEALQRGTQLRNASISGGQGLRILDADGTVQAQISPDRTVTIFDGDGEPVVRMGDMQETGPLEYGIEVRIGASWIQLGSQNVAWENVGAKPSQFPPTNHSHPGGDITSQVASAANASSAAWSAQADGSSRAWNNPVGGSQFFAVWVGNDGNFNLGRNTSSIRYKENWRPHTELDTAILNVQDGLFDRKDQLQDRGEGEIGPAQILRVGSRDEYGAIAEQAAEHAPDIIQYFEDRIDGIRYEMIGLKLLPIVRDHQERIAELEKHRAEDRALILEMKDRLDALTAGGTAP